MQQGMLHLRIHQRRLRSLVIHGLRENRTQWAHSLLGQRAAEAATAAEERLQVLRGSNGVSLSSSPTLGAAPDYGTEPGLGHQSGGRACLKFSSDSESSSSLHSSASSSSLTSLGYLPSDVAFPVLRHLNMSGCCLDSDVLAGLLRLPSLELLRLDLYHPALQTELGLDAVDARVGIPLLLGRLPRLQVVFVTYTYSRSPELYTRRCVSGEASGFMAIRHLYRAALLGLRFPPGVGMGAPKSTTAAWFGPGLPAALWQVEEARAL
jgi:hypothetical protein